MAALGVDQATALLSISLFTTSYLDPSWLGLATPTFLASHHHHHFYLLPSSPDRILYHPPSFTITTTFTTINTAFVSTSTLTLAATTLVCILLTFCNHHTLLPAHIDHPHLHLHLHLLARLALSQVPTSTFITQLRLLSVFDEPAGLAFPSALIHPSLLARRHLPLRLVTTGCSSQPVALSAASADYFISSRSI